MVIRRSLLLYCGVCRSSCCSLQAVGAKHASSPPARPSIVFFAWVCTGVRPKAIPVRDAAVSITPSTRIPAIASPRICKSNKERKAPKQRD